MTNDGSFDVKALSLDLFKSRLSFAEPSLWEKASVRAEPGRAYLQGATEPSLRRAYELDWTGLRDPSLGHQVLGTKYLVQSTWYKVPGTKYQVTST